jgi:hypothetical protein
MRRLLIILMRNLFVSGMSAPCFYAIIGDVDKSLACAGITFVVAIFFGYMIDYQIVKIR